MFDGIKRYFKVRKNRKSLKEIEYHLEHILHMNDDILADSVKREGKALIEETRLMDSGKIEDSLKFIEKAPLRAAKIFPKTNFPVLREYADIIAVAFSVAFGIRALYLQPFKIPTSSMQPTLFGIHYVRDENTLPHLPSGLNYSLFSAQRADLTVKRDGYFDIGSAQTYTHMFFFDRTRFKIGGLGYDLPGDRDQVLKYCFKVRNLKDFARLDNTEFKEGDVLSNGWLSLGDHLFVDRYTYHFRDPRRGDVVVFITENLPCGGPGKFFYIKRLIGMPGDTLKIVDGEVNVKEKSSDKFVPITDFNVKGLDKVYSWKGGYHGHLPEECLANGAEVEIPRDSYFMMGDNSANSSDSRYWGFVPRRNIVGNALFVFWPFSRRWGLVDTVEPLDVETTEGFPQMELQ